MKIIIQTLTISLILFSCFSDINNKKQHQKDNDIGKVYKDTIDRKNQTNDSNSIDKLNYWIQSERTLDEYKSRLREVLNKSDDFLNNNPNFIHSLYPVNDNEYGAFYRLTYSNEGDANLFSKIDILMIEMAKGDNCSECLRLFLNMAEFVDGEYAESYFYEVDKLVKVKIKKICDISENIEAPAKERLYDVFEENCK